MKTVTLPQAVVPIGTVVVGNVRLPVTIDIEWMRALSQLVTRTGGTTGTDTRTIEATANAARALTDSLALGIFGRREVGATPAPGADAASLDWIRAFLPRREAPLDVRPGANVTVVRDAAGFVVSATGGSGSPDSDQAVLAMRIFGV